MIFSAKLEQKLNETISYQAKMNQEKYAHSRGIHGIVDNFQHNDIQNNEQLASTERDREKLVCSSELKENQENLVIITKNI